MGGTVFIVGVAGRVRRRAPGQPTTRPTVSGVLVLFLMAGLGVVGFLDDFIKVFKQRSLGLRSGAKMIGSSSSASVFAVLVAALPQRLRRSPRPTPHLSFLRDFGPSIGPYLFVVLGAHHDRGHRPTR